MRLHFVSRPVLLFGWINGPFIASTNDGTIFRFHGLGDDITTDVKALKLILVIWEMIDLCNHMLVLQVKIENKKGLLEVDMRVLMAG
jgi:hypothetical protein